MMYLPFFDIPSLPIAEAKSGDQFSRRRCGHSFSMKGRKATLKKRNRKHRAMRKALRSK